MNNKIKRPRLQLQYGLFAFFGAFVIMLVIYAACGVYPFGDREIFQIDEFHQYAPFLAELRRKLLSFDSLYFSWNAGLGFNFFAAIGYYAASPLNILLIFFPASNLAEAMALITMLKIGAAALTMHLLLQKAFRRITATTVGFGVAYALSTFVMAYSWNIMWLDAIVLLPLVALGMIQVVQKRGLALYVISVAMLLASNFYMGGIAGIFLALFFPYVWLRFAENNTLASAFTSFVRVAITTITGLLISSIVVLPTIFDLAYTSAANDKFPDTLSFFSTVLDHLGRMFIFAKPEVLGGLPNVYTGMIVLLLLPVYAFAGKISLRARIAGLALLGFIFLSFNLNVLNFIWHGMHYPNSLNHRFAFAFVFLALLLSYDGLLNMPKRKIKIAMPVAATVIVLCLLMQYQKPLEITNYMTIGVLASVCFLLSALQMHDDGKGRSAAAASLLAMLMIIEAASNTGVSFWQTQKTMRFGLRDGFATGKIATELTTVSDKILAEPNGMASRVSFGNPLTTNDGSLYNLPSLNVFCSTYPKAPVQLMEQLGYAVNGVNSIANNHSTHLMDSILGLKYTLVRQNAPRFAEELRQEANFGTSEVKLWRNDNSLGLGFFTTKQLKNIRLSQNDPLQNQIEFASALDIPSDLYVPAGRFATQAAASPSNANPIPNLQPTLPNLPGKGAEAAEILNVKFKDETFAWTPNETGTYALSWQSNNLAMGDIWVNTGVGDIHVTSREKGVANLGQIKQGQAVTLRLVQKEAREGTLTLRVMRLNTAKYKQVMADMASKRFKLTSITSSSFSGEVNAPQSGNLFLSVPSDPGWRFRIDGKEVAADVAFGAMISLPLTAGMHKIEATFVPKGIALGFALSAGSLLFFILLLIWGMRWFAKFDNLFVRSKHVPIDFLNLDL